MEPMTGRLVTRVRVRRAQRAVAKTRFEHLRMSIAEEFMAQEGTRSGGGGGDGGGGGGATRQ